MICQAARDFAQNECKPGVIDREDQYDLAEQVKKMGELGFLGMMVLPEYGGGGMDTVSYVIKRMEEISKVDASSLVLMSVNNSLVCWGVLKNSARKSRKENT